MNNLGGEGGDTAHTLLMKGTIGVGTPHNIERLDLAVYRVGGWVVGGVVFRCLINHFVAPSCKLKLARFSA